MWLPAHTTFAYVSAKCQYLLTGAIHHLLTVQERTKTRSKAPPALSRYAPGVVSYKHQLTADPEHRNRITQKVSCSAGTAGPERTQSVELLQSE